MWKLKIWCILTMVSASTAVSSIKASVSNEDLYEGSSVLITGQVTLSNHSNDLIEDVIFTQNSIQNVIAQFVDGSFSVTSEAVINFNNRLLAKEFTDQWNRKSFSIYISNLTVYDSMKVTMHLRYQSKVIEPFTSYHDAVTSISILIKRHSLRASSNQNYLIIGSSIEMIGEITLHESENCKICSIEIYKNGFNPFPALAETTRKNELVFSITDFGIKTFKNRLLVNSTKQRFIITILNLTASDSMVVNMLMQYTCYDCNDHHFGAVASIPVIMESEKKVFSMKATMNKDKIYIGDSVNITVYISQCDSIKRLLFGDSFSSSHSGSKYFAMFNSTFSDISYDRSPFGKRMSFRSDNNNLFVMSISKLKLSDSMTLYICLRCSHFLDGQFCTTTPIYVQAPWIKASLSNDNLFVGDSVEIIGDISDGSVKTITFLRNVFNVPSNVFAQFANGLFTTTSYGKMLFGERLTFISKDLGFSVFISNLTVADSMTVITQLENENQDGDALDSISINVKAYSELKLQLTMKQLIFIPESLKIMISDYLNKSKMFQDKPRISLSSLSAGITYATIRFNKMSDDNLIEFCRYMENIYPAALHKNGNIANVMVLSNDCCMTDANGEDAYKGKYTFNTTIVNRKTSVLCRHSTDQNKYVTRFCSWSSLKGAYWQDADFSDCDPKSNATKKLISLSKVPTCIGAETSKSCLTPEVKIRKLNEVKNCDSLFATHEDIVLVSNILEDVFIKSSAKLNVTADIFDMVNMVLSIDSSLIILAQNSNNSSKKILAVLQLLANQSVEELKELNLLCKSYSYKHFALALSPVKLTDTLIQTYSWTKKDANVIIMDAAVTCKQKRIDWNASVLIPKSALSLQDNVLFSFVFESPSFFLSSNKSVSLHFDHGENRQNGTGVIVSSIISASVFNHSVKSLKKPIQLSFKNIDHKNLKGYLDCYFWNATLDSWSNAGCRKTFENSFEVRCECDHLTNFALVLDTSQRGYNPLALQIVSWVGSTISLGSLFLSILALVLFRKWSQKLSLKILLQLCISLMMLVAIFIAGAERRSMHLISCRVIAGLLQYFILTTFLWTAVEAVNLYKSFFTVFKNVDPDKFMRISSYLVWGVPLLIVAISTVTARDSFGDCNLCILRGKAFYFGVLTPVSVILLSNFIVLILVMISISNRRLENFVAKEEETQIFRRILRSSRIAFAFSTLLGLTWLFAIVAIGDAMELFQWLFCIFNSLQGLFLFVQYIVRNQDLQVLVRTLWKSLSLKHRKKGAYLGLNKDSSNVLLNHLSN